MGVQSSSLVTLAIKLPMKFHWRYGRSNHWFSQKKMDHAMVGDGNVGSQPWDRVLRKDALFI
jgi:hypothetical protein